MWGMFQEFCNRKIDKNVSLATLLNNGTSRQLERNLKIDLERIGSIEFVFLQSKLFFCTKR